MFAGSVDPLETAYLNHLTQRSPSQTATSPNTWTTKLKINRKEVSFKLDTAISEKVLDIIGHPKLLKPSMQLCGLDHRESSKYGITEYGIIEYEIAKWPLCKKMAVVIRINMSYKMARGSVSCERSMANM